MIGKTAADRFALLPARQCEREQWQRYREQLARYRAAQRQAQHINPADPDSANAPAARSGALGTLG